MDKEKSIQPDLDMSHSQLITRPTAATTTSTTGNTWLLPCARYCFKSFYVLTYLIVVGFPDGTVVKIPPTNARDARDMGSIPGLGRFTRTLKCKEYY